jgi:radical SAM superfamily enzyme YgiQ (UPF0313 family)
VVSVRCSGEEYKVKSVRCGLGAFDIRSPSRRTYGNNSSSSPTKENTAQNSPESKNPPLRKDSPSGKHTFPPVFPTPAQPGREGKPFAHFDKLADFAQQRSGGMLFFAAFAILVFKISSEQKIAKFAKKGTTFCFLAFRRGSAQLQCWRTMNGIALVALNARYSHASLGLRYLRANLGPLRDRSTLLEFTIHDPPDAIAEKILQHHPALICIGVYIWNRLQLEELVATLKTTAPSVPIVLGGPEISFDTNSALASSATCVICGEADLSFRSVCEAILSGQTVPAVVPAVQPDLADITLPYDEYSPDDLANRIIYVETSRGCAYGCEYCISSINPGVRHFMLERLLPEFGRLLDRGALRFKFVDRSFNLAPDHACKVLDFFLARWKPGMCLHLEMTPDRLAPLLRDRILQFPRGGLHIEVGIQTFSEDVARRVGRNTNLEAAAEGIRFLVNEAGAEVHADLIAGLPGETPETFEAGIDRLIALHPAEMQVGILKRLHGAPIARHKKEWAMIFRVTPPYDVLSTSTMDAAYLQKIRRFAMHWDRIVNRGWFPRTISLLLETQPSAFKAFDQLSLRVEQQLGLSGFGMVEVAEILFKLLTEEHTLPVAQVRPLLRNDYLADGRRSDIPGFLREP